MKVEVFTISRNSPIVKRWEAMSKEARGDVPVMLVNLPVHITADGVSDDEGWIMLKEKDMHRYIEEISKDI